MIAVNAAPAAGLPSSEGTIRRCALDDTGTNSVNPWTRPSKAARHNDIAKHANIIGVRSLLLVVLLGCGAHAAPAQPAPPSGARDAAVTVEPGPNESESDTLIDHA